MDDILPRWLYCCLTEALLAAEASMAELDLPGVPGVEWRGEPLLMEAGTRQYTVTRHGVTRLYWVSLFVRLGYVRGADS